MAQVLQRVGNTGHFGQPNVSAPNSSMPGSILAPAGTFPQAFLPQGFPQRVTSASILGGISQSGGSIANSSAGGNRTPVQMLDLYYNSLCQPAFPNITENPVRVFFESVTRLIAHNSPNIRIPCFYNLIQNFYNF